MSGSSVDSRLCFAVGQAVRVESVPREWMRPLVGLKGTIGAVRRNPKVGAYRIDGLVGEPWWLAAVHLSGVEYAEKAKAEGKPRDE